MRPGFGPAALASAALGLVLAGCSTQQLTLTERSGIEQELLVRSLERAVADLPTTSLVGQRVTLELFGLTKDQAFAKAFLRARLEERGINVVDNPAQAELEVRAFASVLGVDRGETLLGIPTVPVPVLAVPIPEIPFFKWTRTRGHTEVQLYAFDRATGRFVARVPEGTGRSKFDEFTILLFIGFTVSDLDERPAPPQATGGADR